MFLELHLKFLLFIRGSAIKIRQEDAIGGFFSQIGELYQVHHIWGKCLYIWIMSLLITVSGCKKHYTLLLLSGVEVN